MRINAIPRLKRLFRLRTILMVVLLSVLFLPLSSLYFFRFYANEQIHKTEIELISQSAAFSAIYRELIQHNTPAKAGDYTPISPQLDLTTQTILPRRPQAQSVIMPNNSDFLSQQAGKKMQTILLNTQTVTLAGIRILDQNGIVVAGRNEVGQSLAYIEEVQSALAGRYHSVLRKRYADQAKPSLNSISRGADMRLFTAFPIIDQDQVYGVVYLSRTPQNMLQHLYSIKGRVILLMLLLLTMTGLLALFLSSRLSRPIHALLEQTQKVTRGEEKTIKAINHPGSYELAELSTSFVEMSHTLQERSHYIQQFASHVSHEFKTPLTSMQGSLELLQDHLADMPIQQQQHFINNLLQDTQRLKDLVNGLLEQARADTLQTSAETCALLTVLTTLKSRYADHNLTLHYDDKQLDYQLMISTTALESILFNLFDNSRQHGADLIQLTVTAEQDHIQLFIQDNGSGISTANQQRIFTPFFTTRREGGGTGLGLGIIRSTLKANGSSIHLKDVDSGTLFIVNLKRIANK